MPRLNQVNPETDSGPGADILNGPLKQKQINIFKGVATNPGVLNGFLEFAGAVKNAGALTAREHEVIALTVGQRNNCNYCLAAHTKIAEGAGFTEDDILGIRRGDADTDKHQALVDFVKAILETKGFVSDEQLDAFRGAGYDDAAVIEVVAGIAQNTFTNLFNHINETEIDFPVAASV